MKKQFITLIFGLIAMVCQAQTDTIRHEVLLETDSGNIRVQLYNETPKHRDNFLKLAKEGKYDGVLFHRVIKRFMVQSGDMGSKAAKPGQQLGDTPEKYSVPAEIVYPKFLHKRGALAAAREPDDVNPEYASSASQFYIVWLSCSSQSPTLVQEFRINYFGRNRIFLRRIAQLLPGFGSLGIHCQPMAVQFFNGGGHADASGGKLYCSIQEAEQIALKAILAFKDQLK